jgi:HD superfamily phosphohydrolase
MCPVSYNYKRKIRDPIHGYIPITEIENAVIDTPIFQRLDRLLQMPTAHYAYPSGMHTRKSHSFGVMHLAHRAICIILFRQHSGLRSSVCPLLYRGAVPPLVNGQESLPDLKDIDEMKDIPWFVQCIRLAGLLHDVGHAPLSHLFEDAYGTTMPAKHARFSHEAMSTRIIRELLSPDFIPVDMADFVAAIIEGGRSSIRN